jgi:hypothetical protein
MQRRSNPLSSVDAQRSERDIYEHPARPKDKKCCVACRQGQGGLAVCECPILTSDRRLNPYCSWFSRAATQNPIGSFPCHGVLRDGVGRDADTRTRQICMSALHLVCGNSCPHPRHPACFLLAIAKVDSRTRLRVGWKAETAGGRQTLHKGVASSVSDQNDVIVAVLAHQCVRADCKCDLVKIRCSTTTRAETQNRTTTTRLAVRAYGYGGDTLRAIASYN